MGELRTKGREEVVAMFSNAEGRGVQRRPREGRIARQNLSTPSDHLLLCPCRDQTNAPLHSVRTMAMYIMH